jgi:DNA-directed RNA polymerase specialized sigma subunit
MPRPVSILSPAGTGEPAQDQTPALTPKPARATTGLLEPEFAPHYQAWKADANPRTAGALVNALQPVLDTAVRTYGGGTPSPTLKSRAKLMALEAAGRYDPQRAKLRTHLLVHLQGLRRYAAREQQIVSVPERVALDLHRMRISTGELTDKLGREPTDQELSDHTGLSRKRIGYVRGARGALAESQLTREGEGGEEVFQPAVVQTHNDHAWTELVYSDLGPQDQLILEHSLGLHGRRVLPKQHIAKKLNLSPGAVSQRAARIQAMLDKREELGVNYL